MDPLPPLNKVYSLLIQEERKRSIRVGNSNGPLVESTALVAKINSGSSSSLTGGYKNHKKGREQLVFSHFGVVGHTMDKFYKIHGYPPGYKPKSRNA